MHRSIQQTGTGTRTRAGTTTPPPPPCELHVLLWKEAVFLGWDHPFPFHLWSPISSSEAMRSSYVQITERFMLTPFRGGAVPCTDTKMAISLSYTKLPRLMQISSPKHRHSFFEPRGTYDGAWSGWSMSVLTTHNCEFVKLNTFIIPPLGRLHQIGLNVMIRLEIARSGILPPAF